MRCYTFRPSKLKRACCLGMEPAQDKKLVLCGGEIPHCIFLPPLYGTEDAARWGRLHIETDLPSGSVLTIWAAASDSPEEPGEILLNRNVLPERKKNYLREHGICPAVNREDILLYELSGRYLWIGLEITHAGEGSIEQVQVINPGDHFMQTFPEVYQERNGVFHRYLSVFSSLYHDIEKETEGLEELFRVDSAPKWMLKEIGRLFGIETGEGLLGMSSLRKLLQNACRYTRMKGTASVMREITQLLSGEEPLIIEKEDGNIVFLLDTELTGEEELRLLFFLEQFKPLYGKLTLLSYEEEAMLDRYCFADINAGIMNPGQGVLDGGFASERCVMGGTGNGYADY